ncbi:MAG: long-chain acyl-CoA synthetase [Actinomycetota bacterium]|nr:long-chain acyl-CoA synthetase [Actinomycetota bacterium]
MTTTIWTPTTLGRRGEQVMQRFGDRESLFFEGRWYRSGELAHRSHRVARGFTDLGVRPGDRVVVCMANCPEVGLTYSALWRAGAVPTPVLFLLTEEEIRHVVTDSGAVACVTTPEFLPKVQAAAAGRPVVVVGDPGDDAIPWEQLEAFEPLPLVDRDGSDLAALLYTGGTTGRSKGVALSHASLDAAGWAGAESAYSPGRNRGILPLPLAHAYGLLVTVAGLHSREAGKSVLMRWFDPVGWITLVEEHRLQTTALVPSMIQMLLAQPLEEHDLSCLERVGSGAAPLARDLIEEFERRVPSCEIREGYGCTESSALISAQPNDARRIGSVGKPVPGVQVRIEDAEGNVLKAGEDGEICVRGPVLMSGYWNAPEATEFAVRDGWLYTGDVGHFDDDGYLYVVDRIKDLIIRGGFNVYPRDVEDVLLAHPAVVGAATVGRPDPKLGEEVVSFVQLAPDAEISADELIAYAREHLGAYKYPREIRFVDSLPLTSVMKLDRKALRAKLTQ